VPGKPGTYKREWEMGSKSRRQPYFKARAT
jgi:hypothetical protein